MPPQTNSNLIEWVRYISQVIIIPLTIAAFLFALRVERFMTKNEEQMSQMVTRTEFESRLREESERVPSGFEFKLADLKEGQANLASDVAQLRRDVINLMIKGKM